MKSKAATVEQYLASLPEDRRGAVSTVRRFILDNLDKNFAECMQYGVIGYCVPHSVWPHGRHTNPKLPRCRAVDDPQAVDHKTEIQCFTGWSKSEHWLLASQSETESG